MIWTPHLACHVFLPFWFAAVRIKSCSLRQLVSKCRAWQVGGRGSEQRHVMFGISVGIVELFSKLDRAIPLKLQEAFRTHPSLDGRWAESRSCSSGPRRMNNFWRPEGGSINAAQYGLRTDFLRALWKLG